MAFTDAKTPLLKTLAEVERAQEDDERTAPRLIFLEKEAASVATPTPRTARPARLPEVCSRHRSILDSGHAAAAFVFFCARR